MLIVSQCGTGFFYSAHFVGAWIKHYGNSTYILKALFRNKEVILGTFKSEIDAITSLNHLIGHLQDDNTKIYQI